MKNICNIFLADWKRISKNVVAVVVVIGLAILPALYAWFNILSNWDPYGQEATSRIKVAVASADKGAMVDGISINMGQNIIDALQTNNTIGWVFEDDTEAAVNGVYAGDYYAALIMPEDFSEKMTSFLTEDMSHPQIEYYTNQKKNAIAPKITDKAKTAVQQQVNSTFISTVAESLVKAADGVDDAAKEHGITSGNQTVLDVVTTKMELVSRQLEAYDTILTALISVTDSASSAINMAGQVSPDMSQTVLGNQRALDAMQDILKITSAGNIINSGVSGDLADGLGRISGTMDSIIGIYAQADGNIGRFSSLISSARINLQDTKSILNELQEEMDETLTQLNDIRDSGNYEMLLRLIGLDADKLGSFISSPVEIETEKIYPVENYGSAMASFYTVLSIWVGALILVAIIHVGVRPQKEHPQFSHTEAFFGRYITFFLIGQAQALLVMLGDLYYIGIQCVSPFKFWLAAAITSFVFSIFMYSLTVAFGNVGEALAVVIMVIQVAGAGCTFPIEVLPEVYRKIYEYLPFTYAMNAMKETVGGQYGMDYWKYLGILLIFAVIAVFIGLVVAIPCKKLNEKIEHSKHKSGVMI